MNEMRLDGMPVPLQRSVIPEPVQLSGQGELAIDDDHRTDYRA